MRAVAADRVRSSLARLAQADLPQLPYVQMYRARVNQQNADGSLDVTPDSQDLPPMGKVRLRLGLPGVTVTVESGANVLVGFEEGDPSKAYCSLWDGGETVDKMVVNSTEIDLVGNSVNLGGDSTLLDAVLKGTSWMSVESAVMLQLGIFFTAVVGDPMMQAMMPATVAAATAAQAYFQVTWPALKAAQNSWLSQKVKVG